MDELSLYFDYKKNYDDQVVYYSVFKLKKEYYTFKWYDKEIENLFKNCKQNHLEVIFKRVKGYTLEEIGNEYNITRERVRQIESGCLKKFKQKFPIQLWEYINKNLQKEKIIFIDDLPIKNKFYKKFLTYYFNKIKAKFFDKVLNAFSYKDYNTFFNELLKLKPILSKDELKLPDKLIDLFISQNLIKKIDNRFFINKFRTKREKIEFIISLFPQGIAVRRDFELIKEQIKKFFPEYESEDERNIIAPIDISDKIILWDWGVYIHIDNIKEVLNANFEEILEYLHETLEQNSPINLQECFDEFKEELSQKKIYNKYALHSILKIKFPEEFTYLGSPWIAKKDENSNSLIESLNKIFLDNQTMSINEVVNVLKTSKIRAKALLDRSKSIIQIDTYRYKHINYILIDKDLFNEIENFILNKVSELEFIYIDLVIDRFNLSFPNMDTAIFVSNYFKKYSTKFQTSNKKFIKNGIKINRDYFNFHRLIKEKILKNKKTISFNEAFNFFYLRGLKNESRFWLNYFYNSKKLVCRINENEISSLENIGINQDIIQKVNELVPYEEININDFIKYLPIINIPWNKFILGDILSTDNEIFPNRNNPMWIKKK